MSLAGMQNKRCRNRLPERQECSPVRGVVFTDKDCIPFCSSSGATCRALQVAPLELQKGMQSLSVNTTPLTGLHSCLSGNRFLHRLFCIPAKLIQLRTPKLYELSKLYELYDLRKWVCKLGVPSVCPAQIVTSSML